MRDSREAFEERRRLAWAATGALRPIFSSSASDAIKVGLFRAVVEPILLYSGETWAVTATLAAEIDSSHRALLRAAINVSWPEVISNLNLYERTAMRPASALLRAKRMDMFGKAGKPEAKEWPLTRLLHNPPKEKYRRRGRPPTTLWHVLQEDITSLNLSLNEAWAAAADAKQWRDILNRL